VVPSSGSATTGRSSVWSVASTLQEHPGVGELSAGQHIARPRFDDMPRMGGGPLPQAAFAQAEGARAGSGLALHGRQTGTVL
jgi:hypothetical protein